MSQRKQAEPTTLKQIKAQGIDPDQPYAVEFFLYFDEEWNAYVAATQLMNLQFQVNVNSLGGPEKWLCLAKKKLKPTSERLVEVSNFMEDVADANSGNYDGWSTSILNN
ncbi:MAG: ribonuclease E inhibitor RraB [Fodinibius sp.]|nr:ribonuclease E inhibitor RraB [Fodinibius sp.]